MDVKWELYNRNDPDRPLVQKDTLARVLGTELVMGSSDSFAKNVAMNVGRIVEKLTEKGVLSLDDINEMFMVNLEMDD